MNSMASEWGYSHNNGPHTWSRSYPEAAGQRQSPIDIQQVNLKVLKTNQKLTWKYIPENTQDIINTGYSWKVNVNGTGSELSGGPLEDRYILEQFHCHWGETDDHGSEHTVNGQKFAGELHLVHWNVTKYHSFTEAAKHPDGLCVVGVFLKPGRRNAELDKVTCRLSSIQYKDQSTKIGSPLNPGLFIPEDSSYYTYQGSLTTPPCSECVIWIVFKDPIEVSQKQLTAFRRLKSYAHMCRIVEMCVCYGDDFKGFVKSNFRPTLPLGQREIRECRQ